LLKVYKQISILHITQHLKCSPMKSQSWLISRCVKSVQGHAYLTDFNPLADDKTHCG